LLQSIKTDLNVDNIGVQIVKTESIEETDDYIEQLYYNKNIGYLIIIGLDLACSSIDECREENPNIFSIADETFSIIGEKTSNSIRIAISWIVAPAAYNTEEKKDFVSNIITTYTYYHNHPDEILSKYNPSYLMLIHPDHKIMFELDPPNYSFSGIRISTEDHERVRKEMQNNPLILSYITHIWEKEAEFGLDNDGTDTTIEEYEQFILEHNLPGLFVEYGGCYSDRPVIRKWWSLSEIKLCCWPQVNIGNGVWAYYRINGNDINCQSIRKGFSEKLFIGLTVRNFSYGFCNSIFGDITAHMI
jgi:hypothetical protein